MVCYYGRQVCKTGLSTNQPGLKMSGIGGFGGSKGAIRRYISRRVVSNLKPCGAISRHGVITGFRTTRCVKRASKCASIAGGVGRVNAPRFKCATKVTVEKDKFEAAYDILVKYFNTLYNNKYNVILVGDKETLRTDLGATISQRLESHGGEIIHITKDTEVYIKAPLQVQEAIDIYNNLELMGYINETLGSVKHIIGLATAEDEAALQNGIVVDGVRKRFGVKLYLNQTKYINMYKNSVLSILVSVGAWVLTNSSAGKSTRQIATVVVKETVSAAEKLEKESKRFFTTTQLGIQRGDPNQLFINGYDIYKLDEEIKCELAKYVSTAIFGQGSEVRKFVDTYCKNGEKIGTLLKSLIPAVQIALGDVDKLRSSSTWEDVYTRIGQLDGLTTAITGPELATAMEYGEKIYRCKSTFPWICF